MPEIRQNFEQNLEQALHLHLSPQMLLKLKTLQLPYADLVAEIDKASEENPLLEIEKPDSLLEYIRYLNSDRKIRKEVDFDEYPGLENIKDLSRDLVGHLLGQLKLENLDENLFVVGEFLIENIDPSGYFREYEKIKAEAMDKFKVAGDKVDELLALIQTFEPDGVGARNLAECLLIQVREYSFDNFELEEVIQEAIENHLDQIARKEYQAVAKAMEISEEGVVEIAEFIRENLTPTPASAFGEETRQVVPSFAVEGARGKYKLVNLEFKYGPRLGISREYERMLKDKKTDAETVKFLRDKLIKAKELIENFQKRGETSQKAVDIIMEVQKEFVEAGAAKLKPLQQKELAERLGLHPSTISRAIAGKYIQTPRGMFPLKFLCPREIVGQTSAAIKAQVLEIIRSEDKAHPYSDEELVVLLAKRGMSIKRRTVTTYRSDLKIETADKRIKG